MIYEVELVIDNYFYEVEADNEQEAEEQAFTQMFEDMHHNLDAIVGEVKIKKVE